MPAGFKPFPARHKRAVNRSNKEFIYSVLNCCELERMALRSVRNDSDSVNSDTTRQKKDIAKLCLLAGDEK
jgi:hypothetical protein